MILRTQQSRVIKLGTNRVQHSQLTLVGNLTLELSPLRTRNNEVSLPSNAKQPARLARGSDLNLPATPDGVARKT